MLRAGDADAESGPLLLSTADYIPMAGGLPKASAALDHLASRGRIVKHLDVAHIAFPTWTVLDPEPTPSTEPPAG